MTQHSGRTASLGLIALATYVFLYLPVVTMVVLSFNDSTTIGLPWGGFTTRWIPRVCRTRVALKRLHLQRRTRRGGQHSCRPASASAPHSRSAGCSSARAWCERADPAAVDPRPSCWRSGQITLWNLRGFLPGLWGSTLLGHLVYTVPFAFLNIFPRVHRFDPNIETAAADLGAAPLTVFRTILLPRILPGLVASMLFCFTLSFDEFVRTLF